MFRLKLLFINADVFDGYVCSLSDFEGYLIFRVRCRMSPHTRKSQRVAGTHGRESSVCSMVPGTSWL